MSLKSAIYAGTVGHERYMPLEHKFRYNLFMLYLDLDEINYIFNGKPLWSASRPTLAWFRRQDHLGDPQEPLAQSVRKLVEKNIGFEPKGSIRMLTHLRYFGYCFNPVSLYYCFDRDDKLLAIVAEVHNTPWGEEYNYIFNMRESQESEESKIFQRKKEFHVSPFMDMEKEYTWRFTIPRENLEVEIQSYSNQNKYFNATLMMKRYPINNKNLRLMLLKFPFMTGKVIGAIYWQALKLKLKGVPFYAHPNI